MENMVVIGIFIGGMALVGIAIIVSMTLNVRWQAQLKQQEMILKQELAERGMSGEEIERVIRAASDTELVRVQRLANEFAKSPEEALKH